MTTVFKTAQSRDNIRARYNQILGAFPFAQKYVDTAFGRTFVLENGDPGKETLILLHGSCSNSAFWFGEICALSDRFHVFAADIIGEAGNSNENRPKLNSDGYADWLREVLDALGIKKAVVAGNSLGGWLALKFAAKYPQRVLKLILIAASGLSGQSSDLLNKAQNAVAQNDPITVDPALTGASALPQEVMEFINLIISGYNPITQQLPVLSDGQLEKLNMPVLFIAGKNDIMVDTIAAAQRLGSCIPGAEIHLLENTGHVVLNALEYMIPFLTQSS
jgi:pimeloyl-ACP methyl ester carboxylesterase